MDPLRNHPARLAAAVASGSMLLVLILLQVVAHVDSGLFESSGRVVPGAVVAVVVLLVVGSLGSWWAVRGIAPGSSVLPVLLSIWMVLLVAVSLASLGSFVVRQNDMSLPGAGVLYGARSGWYAALLAAVLATVAWRSGRYAQVAAAEVEEPQPRARGEAGVVPEGGFVMKRASDFPELTLDAGRDRRGTGPDPDADTEPALEPEPEPDSHPEPDSDPYPAPEPQVSAPDEAPPARSGGSHRRES
ncbi:MAG: hypothetical protein ACR2FG_08185 [Marmoricola sp.]